VLQNDQSALPPVPASAAGGGGGGAAAGSGGAGGSSRRFNVEFLCHEYDNDVPEEMQAWEGGGGGGGGGRGGGAGEGPVRVEGRSKRNNTLFRLLTGYKYAGSTATCCGQVCSTLNPQPQELKPTS
jgi:hypothetical protein